MDKRLRSVWLGFDPREAMAFAVARATVKKETMGSIPIHSIILQDLIDRGLYWRPTEVRDGRLFDVISDHPMATEFAISRFLVPELAGSGWALFMDCDVMARRPMFRLFESVDPSKAVYVVKHKHQPTATTKMDGQVQSAYSRKNWSSVMLFNVEHPANRKLTIEMVNTLPGRDLHAFCWLKDDEIGEIPPTWNWLVGHSEPVGKEGPHIAHFTDGLPTMKGYENSAYADEWRRELYRWAV